MKKHFPFIIVMAIFLIACVAVTAFAIINEPQYVKVVPGAQAGAGANDSGGEDVVPVNINTADSEELQTLPGIGEARAQAIIAYRTEHGSFLYIEELLEISGIGKGIFDGIKDYIYV